MSCKQLCLWPRRIKYEGPGGRARRGEEKQRFQEKERIMNENCILTFLRIKEEPQHSNSKNAAEAPPCGAPTSTGGRGSPRA